MATRTDAALDVALDHYNDRGKLVGATAEVAGQMWDDVNPARIADSWATQLPELTAVVSGAQYGAARPADSYVSAALTAQDVDDEAVSAIDPGGFSGTASDGRGLLTLLTNPVVVTLLSIQDGMDVARALRIGGANLDMLVRTQVADAGRMADQVSLTSRPKAHGYVRVAVGKSCARCLLLAGKEYRWNAGFLRHPRCDCIHVPTGIATAGRLVQDPRRIYDSMTRAERIRAGFTLADQRAIALGSDLDQIVNARHRPGALRTAGGTRPGPGGRAVFTTEGTTRRGFARSRLGPKAPRITPDQIFREAGNDRDEALRLLYRHGYLVENPAKALATMPGPGGPLAPPFPVDVRPALARARNIDRVEKAFSAEARRITGRDVPASFKDHDVDIAREHAEGVLRALEEFPDVDVSVMTALPLGHENAYAVALVDQGVLVFNPRFSSTSAGYRASLARSHGNGFHLRGESTPVGTGAHEVAHLVHHQYDPAGLRRDVSRLIREQAAEAGMDVVPFVQAELGRYALKHLDEMIAAAVSDALTSGAAASRLSKGVLRLMKQRYAAGRKLGGEAVVRASEALDLNRLTVKQLREMAAARGVTVPARAAKADLVRLLDDASGAAVSAPAEALRLEAIGRRGGALTPGQKSAIKKWSTTDTAPDRINTSLREGKAPTPEIDQIDGGMAVSALEQDMTLYRGVNDLIVEGYPARGPAGVRRAFGLPEDRPLPADLTGHEFRELGYSATSTRRGVAEVFGAGNQEGVLLEIRAPRGTHAVQLPGGEDEILLDRGLRFRVTGDRVETKTNLMGRPIHTRVVTVEVIPSPRAPGIPDLEDAARARQVVVDQQRAVADTLSEVAGLLGDEATPRLLTARAEAIAARTTGETKKALTSLVRAMKTGDAAKVDRAIQTAAKKLGLRRVGSATEIVDFDRTLHAGIAGDRIAQGAKVRIVRPGYDTTINGEELRLSKAVVEPLSATEVRDLERRALRAAARERNQFIESKAGTARLLAEVDELLAKQADLRVIRQRLDPALAGPEQPFAGTDPAILDALRTAVDTGQVAKVRTAVTSATRKAGIKATTKSGTKVKYNPDTMELVGGGTVPAGTQVQVVTRGTTVTLPDGTTLQLTKTQVAPVVKPVKAAPAKRAPRSAAKGDASLAARTRELERMSAEPEISSRQLGGGASAYTGVVETRSGRYVAKDYSGAWRPKGHKPTEVDAEQLGSVVLDALGVRAPAAIGRSDHEVLMEFIDGQSGDEIFPARAFWGRDMSTVPEFQVIRDSDEGRLIGLADYLMGNTDRNMGNWMRLPNGRLVGIDHGSAWPQGRVRLNDVPASEFTAWLQKGGAIDPYDLAQQVDIDPRDLAVIRRRLEAARPRFIALGRETWFTQTMRRLDRLERRASGTRRMIKP